MSNCLAGYVLLMWRTERFVDDGVEVRATTAANKAISRVNAPMRVMADAVAAAEVAIDLVAKNAINVVDPVISLVNAPQAVEVAAVAV
ncbi:unnamed protein product, partial [Cylicostephanus goldi]